MEEPADERVAHDEPRAAPIGKAVAGVPREQAEHVPERLQGFRRSEKVTDINAVHHQQDAEPLDRREQRRRHAGSAGADHNEIEGTATPGARSYSIHRQASFRS